MKSRFFLLFFLFMVLFPIPCFTAAESTYGFIDSPLDLHNLRILIFADMNVGNNFFDVKNQFESWNCTVSVIGPAPDVYSCIYSGDSQPINCDLLIDNLTTVELQTYDFLFIPSGPYWADEIYNNETLDFIRRAYDLGLWVGSMCIGGVILASVSNLVNGVKMLCHSYASTKVRNYGGNLLDNATVVSDKRIITGDVGGRPYGGGHTVAPYPEFAAAVVRELLHYSFMKNVTIEEVRDIPNKSHRIQITTENYSTLYKTLLGVKNHSIAQVTLQLYSSNSKSRNHTIPMDKVSENLFEGFIDESFSGDYSVNVEIQTYQDELQVVRSVLTVNTKSIAGFSGLIIVIGALMSFIWIIRQIQSRRNWAALISTRS